MEIQTRKPTLKRFLNKMFRIPQREKGTKLSSGVIVVVSTFKNKQIARTFVDVENRFLKPI